MKLFFGYSFRNLLVRKLTTTLTVLGLGLVVFVFSAVLMLAHGLEETLVETGSPNNAIVVRAAATSETVSIMSRDQAGIIETQPEVAVAQDGSPIAVHELVVLININKRKNNEPSNVVIRGTTDDPFELRPNIKIVQGRMFTPGTSEVIAGSAVAKNFKGCGLGEEVKFAGRTWSVVGVFDAQGKIPAMWPTPAARDSIPNYGAMSSRCSRPSAGQSTARSLCVSKIPRNCRN